MANNLLMQIILKAQDKASAQFKRISNAGQDLSGKLSQTAQKLKSLEQAQRSLANSSKYRDALRQTGEQLARVREREKELMQAIKAKGKATEAQAAEMQRLIDAGKRLQTQQAQQRSKLAEINRQLSAHGINTRNSAAAQQQLAEQHRQAAAAADRQAQAIRRLDAAKASVDRMRSRADTMRSASASAAIGGAAISAGVGHAVSAAVSEQDAMMGVIRQVEGLKHADNSLNKPAIEKFRQEAYELSKILPNSTVEIYNMQAEIAKMGTPLEELKDTTIFVAKAAAGFEVDNVGAFAEEIGRMRTNLKLTRKETEDFVNVINYLDDNATVTGPALIDYTNRVAGMSNLAKISKEHLAALGSTLISTGVASETAAKAVGSIITRLGSAPKMAPVHKALQKIGLDSKQIQKELQIDANAALQKVMQAVAKQPEHLHAELLAGIAGGDYNKVFANLLGNPKEWQRQIELATSPEALGSLDKEFAVRVEAMSSKWQIFKNRLFNTESSAGSLLFDSIAAILDKVGEWLDVVQNWTKANPELAAGIIKTVAALGGLLIGFAAVSAAVAAILVPMAALKLSWLTLFGNAGGYISLLAKLGSAFKAFGGIAIKTIIAVGRAMMANPIIAVIGLIVFALYMLYTHWDKVTAAISAGWAWLKGILRDNPIIGALAGPIGWIATLIANWDKVKAALSAGWAWLKSVFAANPIVQAINAAIAAFNKFGLSWDGIKAAAAAAWESIKSSIVERINSIINTVSNAAAKIKSLFSSTSAPAGANLPPRGFSSGGYTGAGGVNQAAGIVHRGEVVFSQRDVARFGGWQNVEAIRRGVISPAKAPTHATAAAAAPNINITINAAPGQSEQQIAHIVAAKLRELSHSSARRARSSYQDRD